MAERLEAIGAVVIEGPKTCGKTATARNIAKSEVLLDIDRNARRMVAVNPASVLEGATPRLIDEWQQEPEIWNHVRRAVDDRAAPGQFILTGSAIPSDSVTRHTGAGRLTRLRMRPLSLFEAGQSSGKISLKKLLNGEDQKAGKSSLAIRLLTDFICTGGWPGHLGKSVRQSMRANRDYLKEIQRVDILQASEKNRDPAKMGRLLQSLARNVATPAHISTLVADMRGDDTTVNRNTAAEYLNVLQRLMIVEDQPAWTPHLRSSVALRKTPVRHFVDPSLAAAALGATPDKLLNDLKFLGFLFESMVIRDLRIYAQGIEAEVFHYREQRGLEVDAIVEMPDGRWAAFEVKLGERWIDDAIKNLRRMAGRMKTKPEALAVIVPNGYGYVTHGDVGVVPVGALGP